jgi:hypothetical protein
VASATPTWLDKYFPDKKKSGPPKPGKGPGRYAGATQRRPMDKRVRAAIEARLAQKVKEGIAQSEPQEPDRGGILGAIGDLTEGTLGLGVNLLRGASQVIPGLSRQIYEGSKATAGMAVGASPSLLTEALGYRPSFKESARRQGELVADAAIVAPYTQAKYFGGPILEGDFKEAARRAYEDPLGAIGVASIVYPAVGGTIGATLRGVGRVAPGTRVGAAAARGGSKAKVTKSGDVIAPRRERPDEIITDPVTGASVARELRPRSANVVTREFQKYIADPAVRAVKKGIGKVPGRRNPLAPANRYQRVARKDTRELTYSMATQIDQDVLLGAEPWQRAVRAVPKTLGRGKKAKAAYAASLIRAAGLNNISRTQPSRTWGRDALVERWEKGLAEEVTDSTPKDAIKQTEKNIEILRSIPDEWLDPATAPKPLNELVRATERMLSESTNLKVSAGAITTKTAALSTRRAQYIAAGVYDNYRKARKASEEADGYAREVVENASKIAVLKEKIAAGAAAGKKASGKRQELLELQMKQKEAMRREAGKRRKADKNTAILNSAIDPEMKPGQYFPMKPAAKKVKGTRQGLGVTAELRVKTEKQNKGTILRTGSASFAPDVVFNALKDATDVRLRSDTLSMIFSRYAVKGEDGLPLSSDAAKRIASEHPDLYALVSKDDLVRLIPSQEGRFAEKGLTELADQIGGEKFLIPKSVVNEWTGILGRRNAVGKAIDDINNMWKAGVLALSPRWYTQNIFGNSLMFALGAGIDIQSIRMAFNPKYRESVLSDLAAHGVSSDLGELARRYGLRPDRNVVKRVIVAGYKINNRFESLFRRAIFHHVAKKNLKEEGLVKNWGNNSAVLADAWLTVATAAKNGEPWAMKLADQVRIESTRFLGEYVRYNGFERAILRRAYPFYGWMRTVMRLAFALPVKHPKRAGLIIVSSQMAYEMYNDEESANLDPYSGLIDGDNFVQTSILMPQETLTPIVGGLGRMLGLAQRGEYREIPVALAQEATKQAGPLVGLPSVLLTGRSALNLSPQFGDDGGEYGTDPMSGRTYEMDTLSGRPVDVVRPLPIDAMAESYFPILGNVKNALAGTRSNERLASDASLLDIGMYRLFGGDRENLFLPRSPYGQPIERSTLTNVSGSLFAAPIYKYNPESAATQRILSDQRAAEAYIASFRRRLKNKALLTNG